MTDSSGVYSLTGTGSLESDTLAGSEQGICSKAASVAVTGQDRDSQTASIVVTGQDEDSLTASIAVTGQNKDSQEGTPDTSGGSAADAATSGGSTVVTPGDR